MNGDKGIIFITDHSGKEKRYGSIDMKKDSVHGQSKRRAGATIRRNRMPGLDSTLFTAARR
jgi:hypothetical protein